MIKEFANRKILELEADIEYYTKKLVELKMELNLYKKAEEFNVQGD